MPGDEEKNPTPTTIEGLAAMMTKILGRLDALDDIKARLTALESQRAPTSTAPFSYEMPGYGSTLLGSPSFTAAATMATAAFPSFTAPSPVPPQQHCEGIFYGGMAGIQVAAAPLQPAAYHVFAAVRLQAAARSLLAQRRLQEMRRQMHEAALTTVDLGKGGACPSPVGRPPTITPVCCYLHARAGCCFRSRRRQPPTLRQQW